MVSTGLIVICLSILLPAVMAAKCLLSYEDDDYSRKYCLEESDACVVGKLKDGSYRFGCRKESEGHLKINECMTHKDEPDSEFNDIQIAVCSEADCNTKEKWQALCDPSSLSQPPSPLNVQLDSQNQSFTAPSTNSTPESATASSQLMLILSSLIIGVVCIHH